MQNATTDVVNSFLLQYLKKIKLLCYILSSLSLTRYTMYYYTHVANSDFYNVHYLV